MSANGSPVLCDFGISRIHRDGMTLAGTAILRGNARWMAIELLEHDPNVIADHSLHTKASDVWAYGMVLYVRQQYPFRYSMYAKPLVATHIRQTAVLPSE